jgi:hypothetical protein
VRAALQLQIWRDILDFIGDAADGCWSTTVGAVVVRDSAGSMGFATAARISLGAGSALGDMMPALDVPLGLCLRGLPKRWMS